MGAHPTVTGLQLDTAAVSDSAAPTLFAAARSLSLTALGLRCVTLTSSGAAQLASFVAEDRLTDLLVGPAWGGSSAPLAPSGALCATLAGCTRLTRLTWGPCGGDGARLLCALAGHATLQTLRFRCADDAVGPALGKMVAANAAALTFLAVGEKDAPLSEAGLRDLVLALPANTHLRSLDIAHNRLGDGFARDVLLPAVRANASLRSLKVLGNAVSVSHVLVKAEGIPFLRS